MTKNVAPTRLLPDLTRINPDLYPGLPERMPVAQQAQFLDLLCRGASQLHACKVMGIPLLLVWRERHANTEFDDWLEYVTTTARPKALEEIAIQFATRGVPVKTTKRSKKPVVHEGEVLGIAEEETVTEGNEFNTHALLQFLLKGQQRTKYGTERTEANVNVSKQETVHIRTDDDAKRLLAKVRERMQAMLPAIEGEIVPDDGSDLV